MASKPVIAANNNNPGYIPIGITDASGNPYFKAPSGTQGLQSNGSGGGGGDQMTPLWRLDVLRDVQFAKWGLLLLLSAFGVAFIYFTGEFKDVRKDISSIQSSQAAQAATGQAIHDTLDKMDEKLEKIGADAQARSGAKPAASFRQATRGGPNSQ